MSDYPGYVKAGSKPYDPLELMRLTEKKVCLAFFAYAYNLAEVTRALEVARALRERGTAIHFFTHGGTHENLITEAGFPLTTLRPLITPKKHAYLIDLDQGRRLGQPFTVAELTAYVESEVAALQNLHPAAVYAGINLPCVISARAAGVPLIYLLPTPGIPAYFQHGLATFPEGRENWLTRRLRQKWKDRFFNWLVLHMRFGLGNFNKVARHFGVPPLRTILDMLAADLTLLTDLPELTGLPAEALPPTYRYIGPLFAWLPLPVPNEVKRVFSQPGLKIFCAMGSSTPVPVLRTAALALRDSGYNVVVATTSILDPAELAPLPENVYATRYLPAPQVNELADIAVIHGGQGTVQTACWAGIPVIGVAFQFEQQANLDILARVGMGVRIPLREFTGERLLTEVKRVAHNPRYREEAQRIQALVRDTDGAANAAKAILDFIARGQTS
jgi:UDP:flavonoid glycosyltransferase YjiC (YdhE family)